MQGLWHTAIMLRKIQWPLIVFNFVILHIARRWIFCGWWCFLSGDGVGDACIYGGLFRDLEGLASPDEDSSQIKNDLSLYWWVIWRERNCIKEHSIVHIKIFPLVLALLPEEWGVPRWGYFFSLIFLSDISIGTLDCLLLFCFLWRYTVWIYFYFTYQIIFLIIHYMLILLKQTRQFECSSVDPCLGLNYQFKKKWMFNH